MEGSIANKDLLATLATHYNQIYVATDNVTIIFSCFCDCNLPVVCECLTVRGCCCRGRFKQGQFEQWINIIW